MKSKYDAIKAISIGCELFGGSDE
jgi:hypothetical protein